MMRIQLPRHRYDKISSNTLNLFMNGAKLRLCIRLYIFLKIRKTNFIEIFEFPIFLSLLLNGVISKMNQFIIQVFQSILFACCSYISLLVPIAFYESIYTSYEDIAADIKFTLVI